MRGLDGIQGPVYVGTGCVFNRQALYGYDPPVSQKRPKMTCDCWPSWCCCCCGPRSKKSKSKKGERGVLGGFLSMNKKKKMMSYSKRGSGPMFDLEEIEEGLEGYDELEKSSLMSQKNFEKRFGQSPVFITSTLMEDGGLPQGTNPASLIKEAIHVISCGYEEKTEWGKEVFFFSPSTFLQLSFCCYCASSCCSCGLAPFGLDSIEVVRPMAVAQVRELGPITDKLDLGLLSPDWMHAIHGSVSPNGLQS